MRQFQTTVLALGLVALCAPAFGALGGGGTTGGSGGSGGRGKFTAGTDKNLSWIKLGLNEARKAGKPMVLYVYDHNEKNNTTARTFEQKVFSDAEVKQVVGTDFTCIMLRIDDQSWPQQITATASRGASCYVMLADGTPVGSWSKSNTPNARAVALACNSAKAANAAALQRMEQNPPAEFKPPEKPAAVAQGPAAQPDPAEKKPEKVGAVPGLGGGEAEKPPEAKKPDEPKKPKLEDE